MTALTPADRAAGTARSYAMVGFIFYILGICSSLVGVIILFLIPQWRWYYIGMLRFVPSLILTAAGLFVITIGFAVWSWITLKNIEVKRYSEARTASLILGIFGLFLAWLIGGIFFILAYSKLGEVLQPPVTVTAPPQQFCTSCGRAISADVKLCSHCGKEVPP